VRFLYLDASALVKRYVVEPGTPLLNHLFGRVTHDRFCVFNIGIAEVVSILVRKKNGGHLPAAAFAQALLDFGAEIVAPPQIEKLIADNALVLAAIPLIDRYAINSTDAVILRSALGLAVPMRARGDDLILLTSDKRLLKAAQAEGLLTFDPETQTQAELDALIGP
jgi:predicted nucleic acid-binding protein